MNTEIIEKTKAFVKKQLANAEGGHDWFHTKRVFNTAITIAKNENADLLIVQLAALLHDIADSKFHNGDETIGPRLAFEFLRSLNIEENKIEHIVNICLLYTSPSPRDS